MNIKYLSGALLSIPLLPLMYLQGKYIRSRVPKLPEAQGTEGVCLPNKNSVEQLKIISLGESTIAGVGVKTHKDGFTGTFAEELSKLLNQNIQWKVYARSGYTAKKVVEYLIPQITEQQVHLIVIGLGANDAFELNSPSKWKAAIRALIESLQTKFPKAIIVFCNMPPIKEFPAFTKLIKLTIGNLVEILGEELQGIIEEYDNIYYFKEKIIFTEWMEQLALNVEKKDFFSDGVHPSKLTYQIWAKYMAGEIVENNLLPYTMLL